MSLEVFATNPLKPDEGIIYAYNKHGLFGEDRLSPYRLRQYGNSILICHPQNDYFDFDIRVTCGNFSGKQDNTYFYQNSIIEYRDESSHTDDPLRIIEPNKNMPMRKKSCILVVKGGRFEKLCKKNLTFYVFFENPGEFYGYDSFAIGPAR